MTGPDPALPFAHKVRPRHRDRLAVVYVRQSTAQQVACNRESTDLQYQLRQRAVALGWVADRVLVIDDDQGISGPAVENRPGFQRLLAEVSLGLSGSGYARRRSGEPGPLLTDGARRRVVRVPACAAHPLHGVGALGVDAAAVPALRRAQCR